MTVIDHRAANEPGRPAEARTTWSLGRPARGIRHATFNKYLIAAVVLVSASGPLSVFAAPITVGLVRHYRLDEAAGAAVAVDSTGNSDLTQSAEAFVGPVPASGQLGQIGGAWDFERDNGELLDEGDAIFGGAIDLSISAWIKPESLDPAGGASYTLFSEDSGSFAAKDGWLQVNDSGAVAWQIEGVGMLNSPDAVVPNDAWSHLAAVRDAGLMSLYIDGVAVATQVVDGTASSDSVNDLMLGGVEDSDAADAWDGLLDDVGFWERALLPAEVVSIFETGLAGGDLTQASIPEPTGLSVVFAGIALSTVASGRGAAARRRSRDPYASRWTV